MRSTIFPSLFLFSGAFLLAQALPPRARAENVSAQSEVGAPSEQTERERLLAEAKALFARVMESRPDKPQRCMIESEWSNYPIPENVARTYLGLRLHGEVTPPYHGTVPAEIIDPQDRFSDALCNGEQSAAYANELTEAAEKQKKDSGGVPAPTPRRLIIKYTFPVFNDDYTHAVVMTDYTSSSWLTVDRKEPDGAEVKRSYWSMDGAISAEIYVKENGVWKSSGSEQAATFQ